MQLQIHFTIISSSKMKFFKNFILFILYRQMCIVVSCDCFTGVFAGFAVFATIGFLASSIGETVEKYATSSGPGLAFITYPEALSRMPASPFFSIIFFLMLLALGLGSQVSRLITHYTIDNSNFSSIVRLDGCCYYCSNRNISLFCKTTMAYRYNNLYSLLHCQPTICLSCKYRVHDYH